MEEPEASTQSGRGRAAADRRAAAITAGSIVDISGVPVEVRATDSERAAVLDAAIGRLPPHGGPALARVEFGHELPRVPEAPPDESYAERLHLWRRGEVLYLAYGSETAGRVTPVRAEFGGLPTPSFRHFVPLALGHLLAFFDRFVVHAGVVRRDRRVALVTGDSGAGKSTVALAAMLAGWQVLSDDLAIVHLDHGHVLVGTFGLPMTYPGDVLDRPVPQSEPLSGDLRRRWTLGLTPAAGEPEATELVLVHRDPAPKGSLAPLDSQSRFECAVGAFVAAPEPLLLRRYLTAASTVSRIPGWRLGLTPDPATRLEAAAAALDIIVGGTQLASAPTPRSSPSETTNGTTTQSSG